MEKDPELEPDRGDRAGGKTRRECQSPEPGDRAGARARSQSAETEPTENGPALQHRPWHW